MSYPQQPGDQPGQYPQQPGYPQASGYPQYRQYPQQSGYPQQPGPYPAGQAPMPPFPGGGDVQQQPPSKGTTIAAAVLAVLGAVWAIFGAISSLTALGTASPELQMVLWPQAVGYPIEILTLGPGAIMLFRRMSLGRWLVVAGSVVHIVQSIISVVGVLGAVAPSSQLGGGAAAGAGAVGLVIVLAPAIATIILALLPPTGRWLNWAPPSSQQGMPQQW